MSDNSAVVGILLVILLAAVCFVGEPDLVDALIRNLMENCKETT